MKIQKITFKMGNDFSAIMECEHCGHTQRIMIGYDDSYYHNKVIPAMTCQACKKNRSGEIPVESNDFGTKSV